MRQRKIVGIVCLSVMLFSTVCCGKPAAMPVLTATPLLTATPAPTATAAFIKEPALTVTPEPTVAPEVTATPEPTVTPVLTATPTPTAAPVPTATSVPTKAPEPTATPVPTKAPAPTATSVPTVAPRTEAAVTNSSDATDGLYAVGNSVKRENVGGFGEKDKTFYVMEENDYSMPYYVGKQNKSFLSGDEYDMVVYLGLPYYLPKLNKEAAFYSVSDRSIATIEGNALVPLKQGKVTLTGYDSAKKKLFDKTVAVTTYNDGKDVMSARSFEYIDLGRYDNAKDVYYWRDAVNTISDMCYYLQARGFRYDFAKEPEFCGINNWQWTADAEAIFSYSGGVCVQVAQMGNYMLANNFEDWGNILVFGNQGHIFNWYYEDGYYYVMDFTEVISDNCGRDKWVNSNYADYSRSYKKFKTVDEIKEWIPAEKVDTEQNCLVVMYSCQGHDYMPVWLDGGINDTRGLVNGTYDHTAVFGFQDIVYEELTVLWQKEGIDLTIQGFSVEEIPLLVRGRGIYGETKEIRNYFEY